VLYRLLDSSAEQAIGDQIAREIRGRRAKQATQQLGNERDLDEAAREVAEGLASPQKAFASGLTRMNAKRTDGLVAIGTLLHPWHTTAKERKQVQSLLKAQELAFGVVTTHTREERYHWLEPVVLVWYLKKAVTDRDEALPREAQLDVRFKSTAQSNRSRGQR